MGEVHDSNSLASNDFSRVASKYSGHPLAILALLSSFTSAEESQQAIKDCIMSGFVRGRALSCGSPEPQPTNRRRVGQLTEDQMTSEASTDDTSTNTYPGEELHLENQNLDVTSFFRSSLSHSGTRALNNSHVLPHFVTGNPHAQVSSNAHPAEHWKHPLGTQFGPTGSDSTDVQSSLQPQNASGQTTASSLTQSALLFTDTIDPSEPPNSSTFPSIDNILTNQVSALSPASSTPAGSVCTNMPASFSGQISAIPFQPGHVFSSPVPAPSAILQANVKGGKPKWTDLERESIIREWFLDDVNFQMIVPILLRQPAEKAAMEKPVLEELLADRTKRDTLADKYKKVLSNEYMTQAKRNNNSITTQIITLVETVNDMSMKYAPGIDHLRTKVADVAHHVRLNLEATLKSTSHRTIHRFSENNLGPWFDQGENSFFNLILKRLQGLSKVISGTQASLLNPVRGQSQTSARSIQAQTPTSNLNPSPAARVARTARVAYSIPNARSVPTTRATYPVAATGVASPTPTFPDIPAAFALSNHFPHPVAGTYTSANLNKSDALTGHSASTTTLPPLLPGYVHQVYPSIPYATSSPSPSGPLFDPIFPESAGSLGFNPAVLEAPMSPPLSYSRSSVGYSAGNPDGLSVNAGEPNAPREAVIIKPELLPSSVDAMRLAIKMAEVYARLAEDKGGSMIIYAKAQAVLANCRRAEKFLETMQKSWGAAFADSRLREGQAKQAISVADRLFRIGTPNAIASATEMLVNAGTSLNRLAASKETTLGYIAPMALNACGPAVVADPNDIARDSEILAQLLTQVGELTRSGTEESSGVSALATSLDTIQMSDQSAQAGGTPYHF
ncbi:hypothetical protein BN14_10669 [Rhizoctonia solani AG-1 IB]|uniref:Uncharacterized protein n=1 Tax=Thanatephorus cucumeris (strain AG1-IB / isolate 7/3/14) TaxID=1108050 RepID=M5CAT2_THACB|nr:hypothetical protein BN14_10669 [Rhizoctonia solani AG-1 IB]